MPGEIKAQTQVSDITLCTRCIRSPPSPLPMQECSRAEVRPPRGKIKRGEGGGGGGLPVVVGRRRVTTRGRTAVAAAAMAARAADQTFQSAAGSVWCADMGGWGAGLNHALAVATAAVVVAVAVAVAVVARAAAVQRQR